MSKLTKIITTKNALINKAHTTRRDVYGWVEVSIDTVYESLERVWRQHGKEKAVADLEALIRGFHAGHGLVQRVSIRFRRGEPVMYVGDYILCSRWHFWNLDRKSYSFNLRRHRRAMRWSEETGWVYENRSFLYDPDARSARLMSHREAVIERIRKLRRMKATR